MQQFTTFKYKVSSFANLFSTSLLCKFNYSISNSNAASLGSPDNDKNITGSCFFYPE